MTERQALWIAGIAHLVLFAALSLALPRWRPDLPDTDLTPIEVIDIGPATTSPDPAPPAVAPSPRPDPAAETILAAPEPPAQPPAPQPAPPEPVPPVPDTAAQDALAAEPAKQAPAKAPAQPPAQAPAKSPARPRPADPPAFDAGALEQLIDRSAKKPPQRAADGRDASAPGKSSGRADPRTLATLEAAIRAQIAPCWNPPVGGADVKEMTVVLRIRLNRDGSVAAAPELVSQTGETQANAAYARAFVETARRAVLRCAPLDLPPDLYAEWRDFELNFDPRMLT
jgi:outer membrane biosynthesis protein TonB